MPNLQKIMEQEIFIDTLTRKIKNLEFKLQLKSRSSCHIVDKSQNSSDIVQTNQFCLKKRNFESFKNSENKKMEKKKFKFKITKSDQNNLTLTDFFHIDKKPIHLVQSAHILNADVSNTDDVMMSNMSEHAKSIHDSVFKIDNLINRDAHSLPLNKTISQPQHKILLPSSNQNAFASIKHSSDIKENKIAETKYAHKQKEKVLPLISNIHIEVNDKSLEVIKSQKPNKTNSPPIKENLKSKKVLTPLLDRLSEPLEPPSVQVKELERDPISIVPEIKNSTNSSNFEQKTQILKKDQNLENLKENDTLLSTTPSKPKPSIITEQIKHLIFLSEKPYSPDFQSIFDTISKKINILFKLVKTKKSNFLFSCKQNNNLKKYSLTKKLNNIKASDLISVNTISVCLILILFKHRTSLKEDWAEQIMSLISNICRQNANIHNNFCFRILNAIFKKFACDISLDDIKEKQISNPFGYLIMMFNELMYLLESHIISNTDININNSQFSHIKKNSLFKQFALSNIKMLPSNFQFSFFTNIHDLFLSIELVSSFPSVIWSNHKKFEHFRNLFKNDKFKTSIQRLLCLQISQLIPLSDDVKNNFPLIK